MLEELSTSSAQLRMFDIPCKDTEQIMFAHVSAAAQKPNRKPFMRWSCEAHEVSVRLVCVCCHATARRGSKFSHCSIHNIGWRLHWKSRTIYHRSCGPTPTTMCVPRRKSECRDKITVQRRQTPEGARVPWPREQNQWLPRLKERQESLHLLCISFNHMLPLS